jgi:hypothetical protein
MISTSSSLERTTIGVPIGMGAFPPLLRFFDVAVDGDMVELGRAGVDSEVRLCDYTGRGQLASIRRLVSSVDGQIAALPEAAEFLVCCSSERAALLSHLLGALPQAVADSSVVWSNREHLAVSKRLTSESETGKSLSKSGSGESIALSEICDSV